MEFISGLWLWVSGLGFNVLWFLVVLSVLVFFHELGHYAVARWCGVRVMVFSIGFGGEIFGWNDSHGTRWKVSWVPLGGYVKFFGDANAASAAGENLDALTEEERKVSFHHKPLAQRAAVVAAGPIANFVLSLVLLAGLFVFVGQPFTPPIVDSVEPGSAAEAAGFQSGDRVVKIDGTSIERFEAIRQIVASNLGEPLNITVDRGGEQKVLVATPQVVEVTDRKGRVYRIGRLGIRVNAVDFIKHGPLTAVWYAGKETMFLITETLSQVSQMIVGSRSAEGLSGPVGIAKMAGEAAEYGMVSVIRLMALLSVSLGLINLFPIPILDGGHLLFYAIEAIRGKPLGERQQEIGFRIGLALMILLLGFATFNDVIRLLS